MEEKKSSKNNLKRKYLRRNLWREKSSKKNPTVFTKKSLKRNHYQFSFEKKWKKKNRRKIIWRESIYEEIFEEKNLQKKIWRDSISEEIFEEKSLPIFLWKKESWKEKIVEKQSEEKVFTK